MSYKLSNFLSVTQEYKIMSLMFFPNDKQNQKEWAEQTVYRSFTDRNMGKPVPDEIENDMTKDYWIRASNFKSTTQLKKAGEASCKEGIVTGDLLFHVYLMKQVGINEPSLRKARFIVKSKKYTFADGSKKKFTDRDLSVIWSKYKQVSPLWAALRFNDQYNVVDNVFGNPENISVFLSMAKTIEDFAANFVPFRTKTALIPLNSSQVTLDGVMSGVFDGTFNKAFYEKKLKNYKTVN